MKRILIIYFGLLSTLTFSQSESIDELHERVKDLEYNLPSKIALCYKILSIDSTDYEATLELGKAYYWRWDILGEIDNIYLDSSFIMLDKACLSGKVDYRSFFSRGNIYYDFKKFDKAYPDLTKVIQLNNTLFEARWKRASIYMKRSDYKSALSDLNYALDLEDPSCWILHMRAECYLHLGEYQKCKNDLNKALLINDRDNDNYLYLGDYYAIVGKYKQAIKKYNYIISKSPFYAIAYLKRGNSYNALGNSEKAKQDWAKAFELGISVNETSTKIGKDNFGY